ncbi:MAG: precorrin-3B C17-methyltransferase [Halobacteriales archaeon]|jgi:precorrin-3B C17-methyltransferase
MTGRGGSDAGLSRPNRDDHGTLSVVGIGPGLPATLTREAREAIETADCVIAAALYQRFLREDDVLPPEDADRGPTVIESAMGEQTALAREAFERVRDGQDVVHVSGGDPNVYGKSDLLFAVADADGATDVPIEVLPGVTAGLGGAAMLGAPLSNDFCAVSLSTSWRDRDEIETKLRAAARAGFVILLYNPGSAPDLAVETLRGERADDVAVAVLADVGRGDVGRNPDGETYGITTLGDLRDHLADADAASTAVVVGTTDTRVWRNDYRPYLVTPRGGRDVDEF